MAQILYGLNEIHSKNIIHRDIKSDNILLDESKVIKLGDFGVSWIFEESAKTYIGTPYYLSPEIIYGKRYTTKTDVWSLGVLLYEMMTDRMPFNANNITNLQFSIVKGNY